MNFSWLELLFALAGGAVLGFLFFAGLWWTLQRLAGSAKPALLMLSSLALRVAIAACALAWMADKAWQYALVALLGFIAVREIMTRWAQNDRH